MENIRIQAKRLSYEPEKMEIREKSSYLKTDQLHTSLSNKETLLHRQRQRWNQQIPPTTTLSQKCLGRTIDSDSRPEHETLVSDTQNITNSMFSKK